MPKSIQPDSAVTSAAKTAVTVACGVVVLLCLSLFVFAAVGFAFVVLTS